MIKNIKLYWPSKVRNTDVQLDGFESYKHML